MLLRDGEVGPTDASFTSVSGARCEVSGGQGSGHHLLRGRALLADVLLLLVSYSRKLVYVNSYLPEICKH